LKPHRPWALGEDVVDVRRDVARAAKDVDEIDVARNVGETAVHPLAEDLGHVGVVHGDRHDLVARPVRVLGNVERGLC
jgi:hypothetical protein